MSAQSRIIVALDFPEGKTALDFAQRLEPSRCKVKVGSELFTNAGPTVVESLVACGFDVFLDLKFHDIPNTVAAACAAAARLGVWMVNIHASGGRAMLQAARDAIPAARSAPKLIAVTGYGQDEDLQRSREVGIEVHLVKPVDVDKLLAAVNDAGERRQ